MTPPAGLRLWTGYVTLSGGLCEEEAGRVQTLLPANLQAALQLPEETTVTADPEVAEEDGALLLVPGNPLVDRLADRVLEDGDARTSFLPWSRAALPGAPALMERARRAVAVAHGRIDAMGVTAGVHHPLVRVGALLMVRAGDEVREALEVWVDGVTGLPAPAEAVAVALKGPLQPEPAAAYPLTPPLPEVALAAADALLRARAERAAATLAAGASAQLREEVERAEAYYAEELASLARRRESATPERAALYDARAEATRTERGRRLRDIREKYRPAWEIRPYLLHVVHVPAVRLPALVRRGARSDPLPLTWLLPGQVFAPTACPRCGAGDALIATRDGLGCARCVAPQLSPPPAPTAASEPAPMPDAAAAPRTVPAPKPAAASKPVPASKAATVSNGRPAPKAASAIPARGARPAGQAAGIPDPPQAPSHPAPDQVPAAATRHETAPVGGRRGRPGPLSLFEQGAAPPAQEPTRPYSMFEAFGGSPEIADRAVRIGRQLIGDIWQAVLAPQAAPIRAERLRPGSPAATLQRLYGGTGVRLAVGIPAGPYRHHDVQAQWHTRLDPRHRSQVRITSDGEVRIGPRRTYPFRIDWTLDGERPLVVEIAPPAWCSMIANARDEVPPDAVRRLCAPPPPAIALDEVAQRLWEADIGAEGLPFVVRCLTVWWRRAEAEGGSPANLTAAAISYLVAQRSGLATARNHTARRHDVDPERVRATAAILRPAFLPHGAGFWW